MSHPCGNGMVGAQLPAKFFERASDEILRPMQLRSEQAAKNQQKHARFACSGACSPLLCFCSRPCYSPVLYRAEANKIGACKLRLCSCKLDAPKRIDVSLLDVKKARAFTRAGGCRLTIVQPVSGFCQNEPNGRTLRDLNALPSICSYRAGFRGLAPAALLAPDATLRPARRVYNSRRLTAPHPDRRARQLPSSRSGDAYLHS
jgi:hypothetical protein